MNKDKPDSPVDEKGVSVWVKVPPALDDLAVDFSVCLFKADEGGTPGDVAPARPTGKTIAPNPNANLGETGADSKEKCRCEDGKQAGMACAKLRRTENVFRLMIPPLEDMGGAPYDVEIGPLSWAQGWIEGHSGFEGFDNCGGVEPPRSGPKWLDGQHAILVSLISPDARRDGPYAQPNSETGIFAWVKLKRSPQDQKPPYLFRVNLTAKFHRKPEDDGTVVEPTVVELDDIADGEAGPISGKPARLLASIDLKAGRWELYARGAAVQPPGLSWHAAVGPRSQARSWMEQAGKDWSNDAAVYALLTLTTRYDPL